ncbi:alkaline phosphatase D family protein [Limnohabitans sp.]|uniref:alkaline phosphatase D family protein n=1 Tax=Limnohabitans sp. TaxID=1907725 RepID=UPI0037BFF29C
MNPLSCTAHERANQRALWSRRDLHRLALATALAPWAVPGAHAQSAPPRWQANPFGLGVASGQPQPGSVVLWTRLLIGAADAALQAQGAAVVCELFADEALRQPVRQWRLATQASRGHSLHVLADGLQPGRHYWYRFVCGNAVSPVGRTRTSPATDEAVRRLRLGLASCQHYEQGHYAAHQDMAAQDLDLVLFVGDYIYENSNKTFKIRAHESGMPFSLDEYRARHAHYKADPHLQACHAAHPWLMTWDDHEVVNDYANDLDRKYTDPVVFLQRRAAAYQAYFEHMPLRLGPDPLQPSQMRIHDRMAWGTLAEVWTLDCRQHRDHQACPDLMRGGGRVVLGCDALADPARSMLGMPQEQWLTAGLTQSRQRWKLLAQATLMASSGIQTPLGRSTFTDGWDGYPQARARLLQTISDARLSDVVMLGGDVHANVAAQLRLRAGDERSPIVASEVVTTSVSTRGMSPNIMAQIQRDNPDIRHARSDERGYTLIDVRPERPEAQFLTTPHPARPQARLALQARWSVQQGVAGIESGS